MQQLVELFFKGLFCFIQLFLNSINYVVELLKHLIG